MRKNSVIFTTLSLLVSTLFINSVVYAGDIEWSGLYRIEGYQLHNTEMRSSEKRSLGYGLSHLIMRPKITASDGLTIYGQFDIFNATDASAQNSQMGQVFGNGVRAAGDSTQGGTTSSNDSNALSNRQKAETIEVTQLYLTLNQEFGQLIVGRAPLQFGLGMTYSAGRGLFDHWYDTRDLVGYKVVMGNIFILPMFGRPSGGNFNQTNQIDDYMVQLQYENPESDMELGAFYQVRHSGDQGSDAPTGTTNTSTGELGGPGAKNSTGMDMKIASIYALRDNERFRLGLEASFMSGNAGVRTASGDSVTYSGYGVAFEGEYRPESSKFKWGLKAGAAAGDDPTTPAKYEGFSFNRNYDVAMLMFNHPLGQDDFLRSSLVTGTVRDANKYNQTADVEALSNVIYMAPSIRYAFSDKWGLDNTFVTGWLQENPADNTTPTQTQNGSAKDLGYEWDITLSYTPRKGVAWINQAGLLFPGAAWKGGTDASGNNLYTNGFAYGFGTKAAISF